MSLHDDLIARGASPTDAHLIRDLSDHASQQAFKSLTLACKSLPSHLAYEALQLATIDIFIRSAKVLLRTGTATTRDNLILTIQELNQCDRD